MREEPPEHSHDLSAPEGELRRLTIMFCDVVGSTELSGRHEPEAYRELMRTYRDACCEVLEDRFEGNIVQLRGDGTLATFGFPVAHENDAERAVRAGLALIRTLRERSAVDTAEPLEVRIGVHHGPVYLDTEEHDIYGLTANVGARLHGVHNGLQALHEHSVNLRLRELHGGGHVVDELCLGHTPFSSV